MNLRDIEYIVKISEEGNLSRAAEKLFITPSALTQQLVHLEKEIGAPLFFRSRNGWTPTKAGEVYLKTAREMLRMRRETYKELQDIVTTRKGTLSIGFPPDRGVSMFTSVYPAFHRKYPEITINVYEVSVRRQQQMIANGDLDIGFMSLCEKHRTDDEYIVIKKEEFFLAVPTAHPLCEGTASEESACDSFPVLELSALRYEPFARMYKGSTVREFTDDLFRQEDFHPSVLFETSRPNTILSMVAARMCCGLVPGYYVKPEHPDITFFSLPGHPAWDIAASYKKGSHFNKAMQDFVQMAGDYWCRT